MPTLDGRINPIGFSLWRTNAKDRQKQRWKENAAARRADRVHTTLKPLRKQEPGRSRDGPLG
jgi:hypothetical protein